MPPTSDVRSERDLLAHRVRDLEQALASVLAVIPGGGRGTKTRQQQAADAAARVLAAARTPDVTGAAPGKREELLMAAATAVHSALGAPGDFGYETREGHALQCLYAAMGGRRVDYEPGLPSAIAAWQADEPAPSTGPLWLPAGAIPPEPPARELKDVGYVRFAPHLGHAVASMIAIDFADARWRAGAATVRWFGPFPLWPTDQE